MKPRSLNTIYLNLAITILLITYASSTPTFNFNPWQTEAKTTKFSYGSISHIFPFSYFFFLLTTQFGNKLNKRKSAEKLANKWIDPECVFKRDLKDWTLLGFDSLSTELGFSKLFPEEKKKTKSAIKIKDWRNKVNGP